MSAATRWQPEDYAGWRGNRPARLAQYNPHIGFLAYNCYVSRERRAAQVDTAGLMPMFRLQSADSDQWVVVDEQNLVVFRGALRQCEDWLDLQENLQRIATRATARRRWWTKLVLAWLPHRNRGVDERARPHALAHHNEPSAPPASDR